MPDPFPYLDPGSLIDGDLQLIAPEIPLLDAVIAAQNHPLTRRELPAATEISRDRHVEFIHQFPGGFQPGDGEEEIVPAYHFWMHKRDASEFPIVGGIGLRLGFNDNIERVIGHIGYHVYPFARGHHYAERACRLLLPLAARHGIQTLWITCNPDNLASRRTCERLGASLVDIVPVPRDHVLYDRGERQKCRYRLGIS